MSNEFYVSEEWKKRIEQNLGSDIVDPVCRRAWILWERQNLARDIDDAHRRAADGEAHGLRYHSWRLWQELAHVPCR